MSLFEQTQTVSQLTKQIKTVLEAGFETISVEGEISNCKYQSSGHIYLTLKDEGAQIPAVIWRGQTAYLQVKPQDGMKVIAEGGLSVYEPHGKYQLVIRQLKPLGIGALQQAFEDLKFRLSKEGLFNQEFKKSLPPFPEKIGIVTSPTGAAIRDMLSVISRRNPMVQLYLYPVNVQGDGSSKEIAGGIEYFNRQFPVDVLIVGRGGGSLEDLWSFNEESVARAIFKSKIPIISAVGHEIDFTISDFVADVRAATPSMAGELVVKEKRELEEIIDGWVQFMDYSLSEMLRNYRLSVKNMLKSYAFNQPIHTVKTFQQSTFTMNKQLNWLIKQRVETLNRNLSQLSGKLTVLNPENVLSRGYAIVKKGDQIIQSADDVLEKDKISIHLKDGLVNATVSTLQKIKK